MDGENPTTRNNYDLERVWENYGDDKRQQTSIFSRDNLN